MPKIIFVDSQDTEREVEANIGESVMEAAVRNGVPGIDADCGGACACATCHVFIDASFVEKSGDIGEMEKSMLDFAENVQDNSRLSCQIIMTEALDGLRAKTPESQH